MSPFDEASWRRNFRFVWLNNFVTAVGMMAFLPMFPILLRSLGMTEERRVLAWSGALVAGAPLTAAFCGPFWGVLSDRLGHKLMMLRANTAIVLCVGAMAFVHSPWAILILRLLQGMASGFAAPSQTLVSVSAPPDQQGRVAGSLHTAVLAGGVVGPSIGGWVAEHLGVDAAFLFCAALNLGALLVTACCVREPAATRAHERTWADFRRKVLVPVTSLFRAGPLRSMLASLFAIRLGVAFIEPVLTEHVQALTGEQGTAKAGVAGLVFAAAWLPTLLLTPSLGRLGDRKGHARVLVHCAFATAVLYAAQSLATHVGVLAALRFAGGAFFAGVLPAAYGIASRHSSVEGRGGAFGVTFSSLVLANGVGSLLGGWLSAAVGIRVLFLVAAGLMAASAGRLLVGERLARIP